MDERLEFLERNRVRNLKEYNAKVVDKLPYIVVVIDEWADLIMTAGKGVEAPLTRLAQLARAIGIHLIVATQRPSVNVITGSIKANFPTRLSFQVSSGHDSKTILDTVGAENLIGKGDSLLSIAGGKLERIQCAYIDTQEVVKLVDYIAKQPAPESSFRPSFVKMQMEDINENGRDILADEARQICIEKGRCNISLLKRELNIGDKRAARIMAQIQDELA
jgi:S-DNA-T family DNA segregation ATPase FtsK/SpoIIIE